MQTISAYSAIINEAISALTFPAGSLEGLYSPITYALECGGKRLRPVLCLMACEAFSGSCERAVDVALGVEMFHNFTLLHDDVMDNSLMRRGRPSVMAEYGVNSAILSGDTMLTLATQLTMKVDDKHLRRVMDAFNRTAIEVYEGQQLDVDFEQRDDVTIPEYLEMIRLKTSVLLGYSALAGAIVGGATTADADALYKFAEELGIAFQIKDDLLDVYGSADFGKPIGGDILNNKKTYLLLSALHSDFRQQTLEALQLTEAQQKIAAVTAIYDKAGIRETAQRAIEQHSQLAIRALDSISFSEPGARQAFADLCENLINRSK